MPTSSCESVVGLIHISFTQPFSACLRWQAIQEVRRQSLNHRIDGRNVLSALLSFYCFPSVVILLEANEVRTSSLCGEGLSGMPDEQPRRRALACPHSSLSGLGIPPSLPLFSQADFSVGGCRCHTSAASRASDGEGGGERSGGREGGCEWRCWPLPPALFSPPDAGGTPLWHFLISRDYRCSYLRAAMMLDSSLEDGPSSQHLTASVPLSLFVSRESRPYTVAGRPSSVGRAAVGAPPLPSSFPIQFLGPFASPFRPFLPCAVSPAVFCPPAGVERPFSRSSTQTRPPAERKS